MPTRPPRFRISRKGPRHQPEQKPPRSSAYDYQWQKAREQYLIRRPLCAECLNSGRLTTATEVDHIRPHRGDLHLFWDEQNWQPLCKRCHSKKTYKETLGKGYGVRKL